MAQVNSCRVFQFQIILSIILTPRTCSDRLHLVCELCELESFTLYTLFTDVLCIRSCILIFSIIWKV